MFAIVTKYLPATSCRSSRIKAYCSGSSITAPFDHSGPGWTGGAENVALRLVEKMRKEGYSIGDVVGSAELPNRETVYLFR